MQKIDKVKLIDYLKDQLNQSTGLEVADRIDWMEYCETIFIANYQDFCDYLLVLQSAKNRLAMFRKDVEADELRLQFTRRLHNVINSAKALVDHTRSDINRWYGSEVVVQEYQNRIDIDFKSDPLTAFIEDLRNYVAHKGPAPLVAKTTLQGEKEAVAFYIHKESMLQWKKLSAKARQYIEKQEADIDVRNQLSDYKDKVVDFRSWLLRRVKDFHHREIVEVKWYLQAIKFAEEGDIGMVLRSCGIPPEQFQI